MEIFAQVVVPIATFFLGVGFTVLLRHYDRRSAATKELAAELASVAADWHQRVYELRLKADETEPAEFEKALRRYEQNRLDLPKMVRCLAGLGETRQTQQVSLLGRQFLDLYTRQRLEGRYECRFCFLPHRGKSDLQAYDEKAGIHLSSEIEVSFRSHHETISRKPFDLVHLDRIIEESDMLLQRLNAEVGRVRSA